MIITGTESAELNSVVFFFDGLNKSEFQEATATKVWAEQAEKHNQSEEMNKKIFRFQLSFAMKYKRLCRLAECVKRSEYAREHRRA